MANIKSKYQNLILELKSNTKQQNHCLWYQQNLAYKSRQRKLIVHLFVVTLYSIPGTSSFSSTGVSPGFGVDVGVAVGIVEGDWGETAVPVAGGVLESFGCESIK